MFRRISHFGFTLIELSISLLVLSVLIAGILSVVTQEIRRARYGELKMKMDAIESALVQFRKVNNRLPCPADASVATTNTYYGRESTPAGTCTNGSTYSSGNRTALGSDPAATLYGATTVGGSVPVSTLGLPDEYMYDPWGGKFLYVVARNMTAASAFTTYSVTTAITSITMMDANSNTRTTNAIALVLSHGPNGHGAFQVSGSRKYAASSNPFEQINCHCSTGAVNAFAETFYMTQGTNGGSDVTNIYDDVIRYYTRAQFSSASVDMLTE